MYMDGYLKKNLDTAKRTIKKDWDFCFLFDGREGAGKSVMAMQGAFYCDPSFTIDRLCFTPDQFKSAILKAEKYQAIVYDEAYSGLNSRQAMSLVNKSIVGLMTRIRRKNLYVFIVLPCFFDLDKYIALWRSVALIHIYTGDEFKRGFFAFYNYERKKDLYVNGKKFYSYAKPKPNFYGRFTNFYPVDEKEYRNRKEAGEDELQNLEEDSNKYAVQRNAAIHVLHNKIGLTQKEIVNLLEQYGVNMTRENISMITKKSLEYSLLVKSKKDN